MTGDPYKYFRLEARELLEHLGKDILEVDKRADAEAVRRILRSAHTLKGAARVVRQQQIADQAHSIEDVVAPHRDGSLVGKPSIAALLGHLDEIGRLIAMLDEPAPTHAQGRTPEEAPRGVRAELAELDALLDGVTEAHTRLAAIRGAADALEQARQLSDVIAGQLVHRGPARSDAAAERTQAMVEQLRDTLRAIGRGLGGSIEQLDRELDQVRDRAEHVRLVPAESVFTALERTVRDTAQALGKRVVFEATGGDLRLDAHVLGSLHGALVQLARNAVAHGIEPEPARRAAGKPPAGRVTIEIARRGRLLAISCRDDGRGLDLEAIRRAAQRTGIDLPSSETPGGEELMRILLAGGITTSSTVTEVAGRGIGLDVVRATTERLGGGVAVHTASTGTTFELVVPASLASLAAVVVEMDGRRAVLPLDAVRITRRVGDREISRTARTAAVLHDGSAIPFISLEQVLRMNVATAATRDTWSAVILETTEGRAAIGVDRLVGTATVVVRPIPEIAGADAVIGGAAFDAEGNPVLVLDPDAIAIEARREREGAADAPETRTAILVVDDSLTTRTLEQSILESAGYEVDTASSGELGLEAARRKPYALFLVDVEMPGIDGFTFIERVRADAQLRQTPAILVTSRSSAEDRRRGEAVGAQGFIVKGEFDQADLIARIERLVG